MLDLNATTVTVLDANGKPAPGAAFPIPRSLGVRTVYRWTHDAQGGYLIIVTIDTAEGVQSGLMHLSAHGLLNPRFGADGVAVVQDTTRRIAEGRGPYQPQPLEINSVQVLSDGRVLLLESELPYPSCLKSLGLGVQLDFDACWGWIESPQRTWMRRLRSDGSIDESFGAGGRASVGYPSAGIALFAIRADGSPVLVDGAGQIRTFAPDGSPSLERRVSFFPISGAVLPDGGLLLVGRRNETPNGVWVTRLDARLEPIAATGETSGETRLDLAGLYSGDASGESYTGVVRLSPDARYAYFPASYVNTSNNRSRCGGVARLRLDGAPVFDESFGRRGMVCLFADQANGVRVLPSGDVLLQTRDEWSESYPPAMYRLHAGDTPGPGFVRFTGTVSGLGYFGSVNEGEGIVTLRAKRLAGNSGPASVEWKVIEMKGNPSISGAQSGRLEWADGDDADKTFTLSLIDDQLPSPINTNNQPYASSVTLALAPAETSSANAVVGEMTFRLEILDNDSPTLSAQYEALNEAQRRAEGGGSLGPWALFALGLLWLKKQPFRALRRYSAVGGA